MFKQYGENIFLALIVIAVAGGFVYAANKGIECKKAGGVIIRGNIGSDCVKLERLIYIK